VAETFTTSTDNIGLLLKNIYDDEELEEGATTEESSADWQEGQRQVRRHVKHYNLNAIISVGYRVNSVRAVQFLQWATRTLREHLTQGWTLNRQRFEENAEIWDQSKNHPFSSAFHSCDQRFTIEFLL